MTVQDIYDRAVERSNLNDASLVSQDEWVNYISTAEQSIYLEAAQHNPDFFGREGVTASRSYQGNWNLRSAPGNVAAVSLVKVDTVMGTVTGVSAGDKVNMVSIREPEAELAPRAYLRDFTIREHEEELSTDASNFVSRLKVFYSFLPSTRTDPTDQMDLPDQWSPLVVLPLARILAVRDQRPDEVGPLDQEYILHRGIFLQHLGVADEVVVRELARVPASAPQMAMNE